MWIILVREEVSALIDAETGVIYTDGADKKGHTYECHPDSGIRVKGFQIPKWDEAVSMVKEAAMMIPDNHYCGWDLATAETTAGAWWKLTVRHRWVQCRW